MKYYLGMDIGHTKIKVGLFDKNGNNICFSSAQTPFHSNVIEPAVLWQCAALCIKKLIMENDINKDDIKGISCAGHGNGLYLIDKGGKVMDEAYTATFDLAQKYVDTYKSSPRIEELYGYTLQKIWSGQPLMILNYLKNERKDIFDKIGTAFFCKDFINYCLCGNAFTEYTDAAAGGVMNNCLGEYDERVFEILGVAEAGAFFPPIRKSTDIVGFVNEEAARQTGLSVGTAVVAGFFDAAASFVGAGVYDDGACGVISGTWGINASVQSQKPQNQKFLQCVNYIDGSKYLYIESAPTSSVNLEFLLQNVFPHIGYKEADEIVSTFSADAVGLIYRPYIYNADKGNGAFLNLTHEDNYKTMIRALYEGVAFGHKKQLEALTESGVSIDKIVFMGGATNSDVWCQIFADVLAYPLCVPDIKNTGMLGNVMAAVVATSEYADIAEACHALAPRYQTYLPNTDNINAYQTKYKKFLTGRV